MNYAKEITQDIRWYEEGLQIAKKKEYRSESWKLFAMGYVDNMKRKKATLKEKK